MISIVIPTRNRAAILIDVLPSYVQSELVSEIVIVDDASDSDITQMVTAAWGLSIQPAASDCRLEVVRNSQRMGAAYSRNTGVARVTNDYVLFGEDDAYLSVNYVSTLLKVLQSSNNAAIASGQIIYLRPRESTSAAVARFSAQDAEDSNFDYDGFAIDASKRVSQSMCVPMTHALFMSRRSLLAELRFDEDIKSGNGYREESTFQLKCFCRGFDIVLVPNLYCFHYHKSDVSQGGQRTGHFTRLLAVYINNYKFFKRYHSCASARLGKTRGLLLAQLTFFAKFILSSYLKPLVRKLVA